MHSFYVLDAQERSTHSNKELDTGKSASLRTYRTSWKMRHMDNDCYTFCFGFVYFYIYECFV